MPAAPNATRTPPGWGERALLAMALVAMAAVALRPSIRGNDGLGNYVYLASVLRGGDLNFTEDYRAYDTLRQYPYKFAELPVSPATGRPSDRYGIGSAMLWAPFAWVAQGAELRLMGNSGGNLTIAGGGGAIHNPVIYLAPPFERAVGIGTAFWGSLGLMLLYLRLRREHDVWAAAAVLAGLVLATPLGFYMYAHGSMSHGVSFLAAVGAMLALEQAWRRPTRWRLAAVGFWAAWLVLIRVQDASWAALILAAAGWRAMSAAGRARGGVSGGGAWRGILGIALMMGMALLIFSPQLAVWKILYGSFLSGPMPYLDSTAGSFSLWPSHSFEALFSARHGALGWHPLLSVGLVGLAMEMARGLARGTAGEAVDEVAAPNGSATLTLAVLGLVGFAAQCWVVGGWSMWWAGASFGNRFFISSLPFLALGMARVFFAGNSRGWRVACTAILILLIVWNCGLLYQYATEMIPREDPTTWGRIVTQNCVDVPAAVWRKLKRE